MAILGSGIPFFHVGIGPIIAASIAMQVIVALVPSMKELTKMRWGSIPSSSTPNASCSWWPSYRASSPRPS